MFRAKIRPPQGWPAVWWELLIVTVGVLIALVAQQTLETLKAKQDVAEFRRAMDHELGFDLGAYRDRLSQSACLNQRLDELDRWANGLRSGAPLPLATRISRPTTMSLRTSVWESRTAEVTGHLGLRARLAYAMLYDEVRDYEALLNLEREVWNELLNFNEAETLDAGDGLRLRGLIERGRLFDRLITSNWPILHQSAAEANIRAWTDPNLPPSDPAICRPLRWRAG